MINRKVKKLTIEYENGSVEVIVSDNMNHVERNDFHRGAIKHTEGFVSHNIRWRSQKEGEHYEVVPVN